MLNPDTKMIYFSHSLLTGFTDIHHTKQNDI